MNTLVPRQCMPTCGLRPAHITGSCHPHDCLRGDVRPLSLFPLGQATKLDHIQMLETLVSILVPTQSVSAGKGWWW